MSQKLEISMKTEPEEVIARSRFNVLFSIKNIDNVPFQGRISKLNVQFSAASATYKEEDFPKIPRINPGETISLPAVSVYAAEDGIGWVNLQLRNNDGKNALHYLLTIEKGSEWSQILFVKDPESLKMIAILEEVLTEIKKLTDLLGGSSKDG